MKATDIFRLIRKHIILMILMPGLLVSAVFFLTHDTYTSKAMLYTGLTSGTSVQVDQSFNYYTSSASFDNLISVIQSRETSQEVAIRLLAQHLMMNRYDPRFISRESFIDLRKRIPASINKLVVKRMPYIPEAERSIPSKDIEYQADTFSFNDLKKENDMNLQPSYIDRRAYELTVRNLEAVMAHDDTNFIYRLVNFNDPHYSIKAISSVSVQRISNSDLIELKYTSNDPGISQQTLALLSEVCMNNYKKLKETRTDAVVKYFEFKVKQASDRLRTAEDKLLQFNEENNIIDFQDQSRSAVNMQGNLESAIQTKRMKLAGDDVAIKRIEERMNDQKDVQSTNHSLIEKRNQLADLNARITAMETTGSTDSTGKQELADLKSKAAKLNSEIKDDVNSLYSKPVTPLSSSGASIASNWIDYVKDYEETKTALSDLEQRVKSSKKEIVNYAPAGVLLKRIEREISLSEQEYLELLKGLNSAKLKLQDIELTSNIKAVDPPYYPSFPDSSKRLLLMALAAILGFLIVLTAILALEYFDGTLKNPQKASRILQLNPAGIFPKIPMKTSEDRLNFITNRLLEMAIQQIELYPGGTVFQKGPRTILFFSTVSNEGKTLVMENISRKLKKRGKKVIIVNFSGPSLIQDEYFSPEARVELPSAKESSLIHARNEGSPENDRKDPEETEAQKGVALEVPETRISAGEHMVYKVDESYYSLSNYYELLERGDFSSLQSPDFILVELPPILYFPYPSGLVSSSDMAIMVCRSNRVWSEADQGALNTMKKLTRHDPLFLLNGVEMNVVKSAIGNLPQKPGFLKRKMNRSNKEATI